MTKYLIFDPDEEGLQVLNKGTRALVGKIRFYPAWRQYVFEPEPQAIFSDGCLEDIVWKIKLLNK